jgi:hypothetical protein
MEAVMSTTVIGTLLLNYDEETGEEFVTVSYDADFLELDVYARLYYVDRAVDELLLSTEPADEDYEDEEEDEEGEEEEEGDWSVEIYA